MQKSLDDYNEMFGTKYELSQIQGYNGNLNKRLARKDPKYKSRNEQLDLAIVVDRLLTGFDAPCMSTIFIDRQPMGPHDLIQAFSRTNRIFDKNKAYGQIVTFQAPKLFKESVDNAVKLYSAGSTEEALVAEWDEVEPAFRKALAALRVSAEVKQYVEEMQKDNPKVAEIMFQLINEIEQDENKYKGQSILNIVENMKHDCIDKVISDFCVTWYASKEDVLYAALHYRNGEIPNESVIKATIDYQRYKEAEQGKALQKFKYYAQCMAELRKTLDEEIKPLLSAA